ncbi:MAG TPA: hypothetical protein VHG72_22140 [Polyangia bacterium]|nr:hypothetical protein [Polyangia bacterium]
MITLRRLVVVILLGVWSFPATGLATPPPAVFPAARTATPAARNNPADAESEALTAREKKSPALQDFKGGGVSIYIGSGVLLVLVIILLLVLLV